MRLEHLGQSCIRVSDERGVLVVDPGALSSPTALDGADGVLVTHEHIDHVDVGQLAAAVADRDLPVWAPQAVLDAIAAAGAPAGPLHPVAAGDAWEAAGHEVRALGSGRHEVIHADLPRGTNVGYLIDGAILATGDEYVPLPAGVDLDVLLLPVAGPWVRFADAVDYVRAASPRRVLPVHDVFLSEQGRGFVLRTLGPGSLGAGYRYELVEATDAPLEVARRPEVHAALVADDVLRAHPEYAEPVLLEDDETVPPRPEEEVADTQRV